MVSMSGHEFEYHLLEAEEEEEGRWIGDKYVFTIDYCLSSLEFPEDTRLDAKYQDSFHRCRKWCLLAADIQRRLDHGVWPIFKPLLLRQQRALATGIRAVNIDIRHAVWSSLAPGDDAFVYFE